MELQLDKLSTYGIMHNVSRAEIREIIASLEMQGYIQPHSTSEGIKLTGKAREVLFHNEKVKMLIRTKKGRGDRKQAHTLSSSSATELLEKLKALRSKLAKKEGIPAYIVFSNATLQDMAMKAPVTMREFVEVPGVGAYKAERYGRVFIAEIKKHRAMDT